MTQSSSEIGSSSVLLIIDIDATEMGPVGKQLVPFMPGGYTDSISFDKRHKLGM